MATYGLTEDGSPAKLARATMPARLLFGSATLLLLSSMLIGCGVDLPTCDEDMARRVAFKVQGDVTTTPAFEGQALVIRSCGAGGTCHAPAAEGNDRAGVPAGLDFDVRIASADGDPERLRVNQLKVHNHRHSIATEVVRGFMPPGDEGNNQLAEPYVRGPRPDAEPLPDIDSDEGEEILKNWLACGSPVVESVQVPPEEPAEGDPRPGDYCGPGTNGVGDCIVRVRPVPPEPTWTSIYERVIRPQCIRCHQPGAPQLDTSALDLSQQDLAYEQLVDREAAGIACAGMGTLVVGGDPGASLLVDKIDADAPSCGDPMPVGSLLEPEFVDPIETWIEMGAMND